MAHLDRRRASALIARRHPEWLEHQRTQRWLADSHEGGDRYRYADYTLDPTDTSAASVAVPWYRLGPIDFTAAAAASLDYQRIVDRNLVPHRRETSPEGRDLYALRLARTPVPELLARTVETHLAKVFARGVHREGPDRLEAWWRNVDGRGTDVRRWMEEVLASALMVHGQADVVVEHPRAPEGARVDTRADALALGLEGAVVRYVLPENVVWWSLETTGAYREALVLERGPDGAAWWRHWTAEASNRYSPEGDWIEDGSYDHGFGVAPIVRVFDRRKPRCENTGRPRFQEVAELQRAVYNGTSELVLGDVQQSHARLQLPEDLINEGGLIAAGPDGVLPMRKLIGPSGQVSGYQGASYLDPPKTAQDALRTHVEDFRDQADRAGALLKPAGLASRGSTAQSGVAKVADQQDANAVLCRIAEVLEEAETTIARLVLTVLADGRPRPGDLDAVQVEYSRQYDLYTAEDVAAALDAIQRAAAQAGSLPGVEAALIDRLAALTLPGRGEDVAASQQAEIQAFTTRAAGRWSDQAAADETREVTSE